MTYDFLAEITQDTRLKRTSSSRGGQYNGPCPWCGGTDRFRVQPHYGRYGFFACNQCRRSGTAIDYLMLRRGCSKQHALATVGWEPQDGRRLSEEHSSFSTTEPPWLGGTAGAVATRCDCLLPGLPARPVVGSW